MGVGVRELGLHQPGPWPFRGAPARPLRPCPWPCPCRPACCSPITQQPILRPMCSCALPELPNSFGHCLATIYVSLPFPPGPAVGPSMCLPACCLAPQVYAASVMFGYFIRRVDTRFQLEKQLGTLPLSQEDAVARLERMFAAVRGEEGHWGLGGGAGERRGLAVETKSAGRQGR